MHLSRATIVALTMLGVNLSQISGANAEVSFTSGTNAVTLSEILDDAGEKVFLFNRLPEGESTTLTFSTDSPCPGVAVTGGGEFASPWSCSEGVITATIIDRGGLSFGPGPEGPPSTFYVIFSDPPAPPGDESPVTALAGIQLSIFGDVSRWDLDGSVGSAGATFGVELGGPEGGEAHFRMDLPPPAVEYLGGVLGVFIDGKPDPFASVISNEDGSVSIDVDIEKLTAGRSAPAVQAAPRTVTKRITSGERSLGIGFSKSSVKTGQRVTLKMCAGADFRSGDRVAARFTSGGRVLSLRKSFRLDSTGCAQGAIQLKSVKPGSLTASVRYKGANARATLKVKK